MITVVCITGVGIGYHLLLNSIIRCIQRKWRPAGLRQRKHLIVRAVVTLLIRNVCDVSLRFWGRQQPDGRLLPPYNGTVNIDCVGHGSLNKV